MKKFLATLLTVAMVLSTMSFVAMADDTTVSVWDGIAVDTSWYNAAETEYVIKSAAEFAGLAELVNNGETKFNGKTVKLAVDIDLNQRDWTPIGSDEADTSFRGNFDGQGHTISNLWVSKDDDYLGLFGYAGVGGDQGVVYFKDLTLNNATVISTVTNSHAGSYVGGVCANARVCTFNNVDLTGEINIQGYGYVGGIVGHSYATMTDCDVYAYGSINCNYWGCGALIGYMGEGMKEGIKNCTVISDEDNGGLGLWSAYGGIGAAAGLLEDDSTLDSVSVKDVSIDSDSDYCVGYISGGNSSTNSFVENIDVRVNGVEHTPADANATLNPVVKIGNTCYATLQDALDAVANSIEADVVIELVDDGSFDVTSWDALAIGNDSSNTITINGNGNTLTFNQLDSDWNNIATKNGAKLILNDMKIANIGYNNGPWNRYDINFACDVELNNVVSEKAMAFKADATLNNVTVNESGDNYAIWIQANGQNVAIDGLKVNSAGRGIKIDEEYVDAPKKVTLGIENAEFTTAKKSAILVKSAAGADITANNVDISKVTADSINLVWVDESSAYSYGKVTVTGATMDVEGGAESFACSILSNDGNVIGYYTTLQLAVDSAAEGDTIKIIGDITAEEATSKDDMIVIDKDITISGSTLAKTAKTLTNVAFNVKEGSKVKFDSLNFAGMSYIYVDNADVTVNNCYADVNLKQLIGNNVPPSFIAMSGSQDLNKNSTITLTNNTIVVTSSVHQYPNVIGGWNLLDNLTITGNTLGSEEKPYNWAAIKPMNYTNGATVNISNNTIYGSTAKYGKCFAIQLSHQNSRDNYFVATIDNNKCINIAATELSNTMKLVDIDGNGTYISPRVNVTSSNTLNGAMVTMNNINVASSKVQGHGFVGMDLELDENGFLTGGYLNSSIDSSAYLANGYTAISYADGVNKVVKAEYLVDTVYVEFEDVTTKEGEKLYNVNLKAAADEIIYRLNSADLTFALSNDKMAYEVIKVDDITVTTDADYENRYMFNFNGKDAVDDTKNSITIAQIKVTGYGTFDLAVDNGVDTNVAYATKTYDNIVDTFIVNGSASGLGTLDISNKVKDAVITVPTRKLTVNVTFPNTVVNKVADFQKMTVTISGADFTKDYALGNNEGGNAAYVVTEDLTLNNTYTVTVKGDGYRTARYTVTMTEAKTLNFWNNVMDKEIEVEEGKASSAVTKNFLAGDIVADNNINIYDLSAVVSYFTESSKDNADYIKYDLNRDGVIDSKDVAYVLVSWGN